MQMLAVNKQVWYNAKYHKIKDMCVDCKSGYIRVGTHNDGKRNNQMPLQLQKKIAAGCQYIICV